MLRSMIRATIITLLTLLLDGAAFAQIASIDCTSQLCYSNRCSVERSKASCVNVGTLGSCAVFLSSGHIFGSEIANSDVRVIVRQASVRIEGRSYPAKLLGWVFGTRVDASCWVVRCPPAALQSYPLATRLPDVGSRVRVLGFGPAQDRLSESSTTVSDQSGGKVIVRSNFAAGDSGGALIGESGQVVGIIDGYRTDRRNYGVATSAADLRAWIRKHWPQVMLMTLPKADRIEAEAGGERSGSSLRPEGLLPPASASPASGAPAAESISIARLTQLEKQLAELTQKVDAQGATQVSINRELTQQLVAIRQQTLKPIAVELVDADGKTIERETYDVHNGEAIRLKFEKYR